MEKSFEQIPGRYHFVSTRSGVAAMMGRVPLIPSTAAEDGTMRTAAQLMAVDMACGAAAGLGVVPDWSVTADTDLHFLSPVRRGPLRVEAVCLRGGKKMSLAEARLFDEGDGDRLVAIATANHGVLTPEFEPPLVSMALGAERAFSVPDHPEDETLETYFEVLRSEDELRLPLSPKSCNPWGMLHGGLHGLMIDALVSAEGVMHPQGVSIRFMNAVREGDAVARIVDRWDQGDGEVLRIEVQDSKNQRVASMAHVRSGPQRV